MAFKYMTFDDSPERRYVSDASTGLQRLSIDTDLVQLSFKERDYNYAKELLADITPAFEVTQGHSNYMMTFRGEEENAQLAAKIILALTQEKSIGKSQKAFPVITPEDAAFILGNEIAVSEKPLESIGMKVTSDRMGMQIYMPEGNYEGRWLSMQELGERRDVDVVLPTTRVDFVNEQDLDRFIAVATKRDYLIESRVSQASPGYQVRTHAVTFHGRVDDAVKLLEEAKLFMPEGLKNAVIEMAGKRTDPFGGLKPQTMAAQIAEGAGILREAAKYQQTLNSQGRGASGAPLTRA